MSPSDVSHMEQAAARRLEDAGLALGPNPVIEINAHGIGRVPRINEAEYSSQYLTMESGAEWPLHAHARKKKTLFVLSGEVALWVDGQTVMLTPGEAYTVNPGVQHALRSLGGAVLEEVATHDDPADVFLSERADA